ncbi:MAG: VCBS repeat-containing protein [Planctomycetes bacterium]|nr:VCBS repeat-containing protein [Planctomycetota bacterium]
MSPQFVDFDADGRLDLVAATFDGSPKWARGTAAGFEQPVHVLDRDGARIVMNAWWNFDAKKWDATTRCDPPGAADGHLTSAWACDFDFDGDLDLLLGDHRAGQVMWRRNDGTSARPQFAPQNELVQADGKPLVVPGTVTTLRLADVDRDGRDDLVVGSMGDAYGDAPGGGVTVHLDGGDGKVRRFGPPIVWVEPSAKGQAAPTRPDSGLYMDVVDHDADGDLDLVVGAYSHWTPPVPQLTAAQQQRAAELQRQLEALEQKVEAIYAELDRATATLAEAERDAKFRELLSARQPELKGLSEQRAAAERELDPLVPGVKRQSFVWLYENVTPK